MLGGLPPSEETNNGEMGETGAGTCAGPTTDSSQGVIPDGHGDYLVHVQTLVPDGNVITVGGTPITLPPSGDVVIIGTHTERVSEVIDTAATSLPPLIIAGQTFTPDGNGAYVVDGQTITPGAGAVVPTISPGANSDASQTLSDQQEQQPAGIPVNGQSGLSTGGGSPAAISVNAAGSQLDSGTTKNTIDVGTSYNTVLSPSPNITAATTSPGDQSQPPGPGNLVFTSAAASIASASTLTVLSVLSFLTFFNVNPR